MINIVINLLFICVGQRYHTFVQTWPRAST